MLQQRGHLTAMTGDGVNDAPSLSRADCGIAVEGASDAARAAADVVFLDEGLSTIITSIKVSRQIFHRMKAYIQYRIALCLHLEVRVFRSFSRDRALTTTARTDLPAPVDPHPERGHPRRPDRLHRHLRRRRHDRHCLRQRPARGPAGRVAAAQDLDHLVRPRRRPRRRHLDPPRHHVPAERGRHPKLWRRPVDPLPRGLAHRELAHLHHPRRRHPPVLAARRRHPRRRRPRDRLLLVWLAQRRRPVDPRRGPPWRLDRHCHGRSRLRLLPCVSLPFSATAKWER